MLPASNCGAQCSAPHGDVWDGVTRCTVVHIPTETHTQLIVCMYSNNIKINYLSVTKPIIKTYTITITE